MCTVVTGVPTMCFKDANLQAKGLVPPLTPAGAQRLGMWVLSLPPGDGDRAGPQRGCARHCRKNTSGFPQEVGYFKFN